MSDTYSWTVPDAIIEVERRTKFGTDSDSDSQAHNTISLDTILARATQIARTIQTLTGCQVLFKRLDTRAGHYMFEPGADDTYLIVSTVPLIEGRFNEFWQAILGLASYHLSIPKDDWRRLIRIDAFYRNGHLVAPYSEHLNIQTNYIFLCGIIMRENDLYDTNFNHNTTTTDSSRNSRSSTAETEMEISLYNPFAFNSTLSRFWSVTPGDDLKPTIAGEFYHIVS
jgi:hypothetical protein